MGGFPHYTRNMCTLRNVLDQPMGKRSFLGTPKNGAPKRLLGCLLLLLDCCCNFLVGSGWLQSFPGGLWMVAIVSWWVLDGCCFFFVRLIFNSSVIGFLGVFGLGRGVDTVCELQFGEQAPWGQTPDPRDVVPRLIKSRNLMTLKSARSVLCSEIKLSLIHQFLRFRSRLPWQTAVKRCVPNYMQTFQCLHKTPSTGEAMHLRWRAITSRLPCKT